MVHNDCFYMVPGAAYQDIKDLTSSSSFWHDLVRHCRHYYLEDLTESECQSIPLLSVDSDEEANTQINLNILNK